MTSAKTFSEPRRCGHCGNTAPMEVTTQFSRLTEHEGDATMASWEEGYIYDALVCPACFGITFRRYYWHDSMDPGYDHIEFEQLYPGPESFPEGLPDRISKAYEASQKVRTVDPNAYGVLAGRVLELVCIDRGAEGHFLGNKLADLASKGEIPIKLVDVANGLKDLRNVGAHAALGELTRDEVPILDELTRAILEYVYSAPALAGRAERQLQQLRNKQIPP